VTAPLIVFGGRATALRPTGNQEVSDDLSLGIGDGMRVEDQNGIREVGLVARNRMGGCGWKRPELCPIEGLALSLSRSFLQSRSVNV